MNLRAGDFPGYSGSGNAGIHSVGPPDPLEKALGILAAGSGDAAVTPAMGLEIVNMSGGPLIEVTLSFTQENWRRPGAGAGSTVGTINTTPAEYGTTGSGITSETIFTATSGFTSVTSLDLVSVPPADDPGSPGTHLPATVILGNDPANQAFRTVSIDFSSDPIGVGQSLFLRYIEFNEVGGDAIMAIDDFTFMAVSAPGALGDFNSDGAVDAADYVTWRRNVGSTNPLPNDNDLGTPIDSQHYTLWRSNFGEPNASAAMLGVAVPEPSTAGLMLLTFLTLVSRNPWSRGAGR